MPRSLSFATCFEAKEPADNAILRRCEYESLEFRRCEYEGIIRGFAIFSFLYFYLRGSYRFWFEERAMLTPFSSPHGVRS